MIPVAPKAFPILPGQVGQFSQMGFANSCPSATEGDLTARGRLLRERIYYRIGVTMSMGSGGKYVREQLS